MKTTKAREARIQRRAALKSSKRRQADNSFQSAITALVRVVASKFRDEYEGQKLVSKVNSYLKQHGISLDPTYVLPVCASNPGHLG